MNTTQEHIPIKEISDDVIFLKNGSGALVLQVSAVNFGLLSEKEQIGIIGSFAQMLNSLSFSIQIVIYSRRLNISSYLLRLDMARQTQRNPLLSQLMGQYRQFIQALIKENEVLDKKFYVVIPLFKLELGLITSKERLTQKIKTILLPRRDQLIRQLSRAGLKAVQLDNEKLIELFFDIYNEETPGSTQLEVQPAQLNTPQLASPSGEPAKKDTSATSPTTSEPSTQATAQPSSRGEPITRPSQPKNHPFVVEELEENV